MKVCPMIFVLITSVFAVICSFAGPADAVDTEAESADAQACLPPPFTCAIDDDELQTWRTATDFIAIDTRSEQNYSVAHISGALNYPLFAVRTKNFLKGKSVLLVGEDYEMQQFETKCAELQKLGFTKLRYLRGGMKYWREAGGKVDGSAVEAAYSSISASALANEVRGTPWILLTLACESEKHDAATLPDIKFITGKEVKDGAGNLVISAEGLPQPSGKSTASLVIIACGNDPDAVYQRIAPAVDRLKLPYVYYVKGGMNEMIRFRSQYQAIIKGSQANLNGAPQCR